MKEQKPKPEQYGWREKNGFDDLDSGWTIEGGKEAYYEALEKWQKLHNINN